MSSRWQMNKAGLVDFWYYDEEEFAFADGRMLLRGTNGSGKSVTMQSFIPVILDGNIQPERLDPFGSRARKMENYLLEEEDGREERIGYLYLEFKRTDSDTYFTIGIGLRARRNKKMETWYFAIQDGRRIGKDFLLYRDAKNKVAMSKLELRNRIGEGGKLFESQGEYAAYVNSHLFGFQTQEEYKELLKLLIQLRTPKLSKDFKPSVVNDILSASLQTLSEDDLRPMSEAIENMDALKTNLDNLEDALRAAKQIERVLKQYNEITLYDKALYFCDAEKKLKELQDYKIQQEEARERCIKEEKAARQRYEELCLEEKVLKEEQASLAGSDAARLKEEELQLEASLATEQRNLELKKKQEEEKKMRYTDVEDRNKKQQEKNDLLWDEIVELTEAGQEEMEGVPFDEEEFFRKELLEKKGEEVSFQSHAALLRQYQAKIEKASKCLREEQAQRDRYDRRLLELDGFRKKQEQAERELRIKEEALEEAKAVLLEQIAIWNTNNKHLILEESQLHTVYRNVELFRYGQDYGEIQMSLRPVLYAAERELEEKRREAAQIAKELGMEAQQCRQELEEWKGKKDPEPERSREVKENREALKEKGIAYLPFYEAVEFSEDFPEEKADRLEEALSRMGILDALIVDPQDRETILQMNAGVADQYLFTDVSRVKKNLSAWLEIDNAEYDILKYASVYKILEGISIKDLKVNESDTWIDENGNYRLGILEGTISGTYKASFIGSRSRERYRLSRIALLQEQVSILEEKIQIQEDIIMDCNQKIAELEGEWKQFPEGGNLKSAAGEVAGQEFQLEHLSSQIALCQNEVDQERKILNELRRKSKEACEACYLPVNAEVVEETIRALSGYQQILSDLRVAYNKYSEGKAYLKEQMLYLEDLEADLDQIRYELVQLERKIQAAKVRLEGVREQLQLTDYEAIKERLDACLLRLQKIPSERDEAVIQKTRCENEEKNIESRIRDSESKTYAKQLELERFRSGFSAEFALGYVGLTFEVSDHLSENAKNVCRMMEGKFKNKKQSDLQGSLQEVYHQNRGYLPEYQLTMQTLFSEMDEDTGFDTIGMKRIDITAKYRGASLSFAKLLPKLEEDAQEQRRLLSDKDKELFEDILANTISKKIRTRILASRRWVARMNELMESMKTSSGLKLSLKWKQKRAEKEEQLDTNLLVELLSKDVEIMRTEDVEKVSSHFRSKIEEARRIMNDTGTTQSFHAVMREVLDYRKWFEFQLECQKTGEKKKEMTDRIFFTFSGGEKAMAMYVPLFSAVVAKYSGAKEDAPRVISLDEAFAGVDETNIRDMFRLMVEFEFNFMINSQILWGDHDTVPSLAIYQLLRQENAKFVTVIAYRWDGKKKELVV